MSSGELANIYRNAAAVLQAKLSSSPGVAKVLAEIGRRVPDAVADPRTHRDLFFEPRIDAQQLGVPTETAEEVAVWLHRFGVLRLWVRVRCPDTEEYEDGTILETDDPSEFDQLASRSCEYCGRYHDLDEDNCETIYAINTTQRDDAQRFDYSRLASTFSHRGGQGGGVMVQGTAARCEVVAERYDNEVSLGQAIVFALQANRAVEPVPAPSSVWWNAWGGPLVILLTYLVLLIPIVRLCGQVIACVASVVVLGVIFFVIRGQVMAKLAPTAVQRTAMYLGFPIATCCITAGVTGFKLDASAGEGHPWWACIAFGEQSNTLIVMGSLLFVTVLVFVGAYDFQRGWLKRR